MENQGSPKSLRILELLLVTGVAFAATIFVSIYSLFSNTLTPNIQAGQALVFYGLVYELLAIAVLCYVLFRQGRSLRELGLSFAWKDIPVSVLLAVIAYVAFYACYTTIYSGYHAAAGQALTQPDQAQTYLDAGLSLGTVLLVLINPIYEELIARAYIISEIKFLTGSAVVAVVLSVAVQVLYHLYQGVPAAISLGAMFLILSLYYARHKRIGPVILAHLYFDALALLAHAK